MKFYDSIGPNPRVIRMFIKEKGIDIEQQYIDLMSMENRKSDYLKINAMGTTPALILDDGQVISEILPICEYLEERYPTPALIGETPEQRGETRMWLRRLDLNLVLPMTLGFRYGEGVDFFKERVRVIPEASPGMKTLAQDYFDFLEPRLGDQPYICGDRFTLADILLYSFVAFGGTIGQPLPEQCTHLRQWFERVGQRDSAGASEEPAAA